MAGGYQTEVSNLSADRALKKLMAERGYSNRKLAAATKEADPTGRGLGQASIGNIARGDDRASAAALKLIADATGVPPEYFAEYRLALARRALDEREVGLDAALETLSAIEDALAGSATEHALHAARPAPDRQRPPRAAGRGR